MSDEIREQLSALIDDELSDLERPLLLGRLERDAALRECLGRYQLIGEVLRGADRTATLSVAGRVESAMQQEAAIGPLPGSRARRAASRWKALAGLGVAASVALLAVLGVNTLQQSTAPPLPVASSDDAETVVAPVARVDDEKWNRIQPQIDERLSGYLVNHNEYAASRGVQGVMPYVRIVGFDNDQ